MDQQSKNQLEPLPKSDDKFWEGAENEKMTLGADRVCGKGTHSFIRIKQNEAKCQKCPLGFILPPGGDVKDSSIYIENERLI